MRRALPALLAVVVLLVALPGVAAAETRTGGTVTVGPDETIDGDLEAVGGTVVIEGTVTGDVEAVAGSVEIAGDVGGDLEVSGGSVTISGSVAGDVDAPGGSVEVTDAGEIGGTLNAAGGSVVVDGTVGEDANLAADEIRLGPDARIGGTLTYDGVLDRADGAVVGGEVTRSDDVSVGPTGPSLSLPDGSFTAYGVLANLVAGAVLLAAFPRFSETVADGIREEPVRSGGVGLVALIAVPVVLGLLLLTVVGIPLSFAGTVAFVLLVWAGALYGRYVLGALLLERVGRDSRWLALAAGVLLVAALKLVPVLGEAVDATLALVGFGAVVVALRDRYEGRSGEQAPPPTDAREADAEAV